VTLFVRRKVAATTQRNYPIPREGAIYSPNILVIRSNENSGYKFLADPVWISFVSCAPMMYPGAQGSRDVTEWTKTMKAKIKTILHIAIENEHNAVVLSAFGCGTNKCPPEIVAGLFNEIIIEFGGYFERIVFAIFRDQTSTEGNVKPFSKVFKTQDMTFPQWEKQVLKRL